MLKPLGKLKKVLDFPVAFGKTECGLFFLFFKISFPKIGFKIFVTTTMN